MVCEIKLSSLAFVTLLISFCRRLNKIFAYFYEKIYTPELILTKILFKFCIHKSRRRLLDSLQIKLSNYTLKDDFEINNIIEVCKRFKLLEILNFGDTLYTTT